MLRVLLDEDLDVRLREHFESGLEVATVSQRGWTGKKNGELLRLAEADFDVFVTGDSNLSFQQNLSKFDIAVIVLRPRSKSLSDLVELIPAAVRVMRDARVGQAVEVLPTDR